MEMKKLTPEWLANKIIFNDTSDESLTRASKIQITKVEMNDSEGTLIVRADGTAHFSCETWTDQTHSGDSWQVGFSFTFSQ